MYNEVKGKCKWNWNAKYKMTLVESEAPLEKQNMQHASC